MSNKYQPQTIEDIEKTVQMIEGTLKVLMQYKNPPEGLLNNLILRQNQYKALLPKKKVFPNQKKSLLFPNSPYYA